MEKKKFHMEISEEEIRAKLADAISSPYNTQADETLVDCIMSMVKDDDHKSSTLFRALLGIKPDIQYEAGDEIVIRTFAISTYDMNTEEMKSRGHIFEIGGKDCMNVKITAVDPYNEYPYTLRVEYYDSDSANREDKSVIPETKIKHQQIKDIYIVGRQEEWPEL